ncbi:hypothetical protein [Agaribacter marinus]|uniref:LRAT domain-containing protein n=1 Tax=Agaribacter marinus TaxID=1431249 RepID=A0AA37WJL6_9ALTE|nr:hypothetical protein [Agaribacter marinus]GLR69935.1 hypothetical protein GCM10007852_08430 [Agaribacter marinus]
MPAPLLWLGAAALGIYASNKANTANMRRKGIVSIMPEDDSFGVIPKNGTVVCCGIYEILDHTGVWVDGNIYELNGSGLVRCVSPERFLSNRSGDAIYAACSDVDVIGDELCALRAKEHLYALYDYHLIRQNCHRFVAEMILGANRDVTSFSELNEFLHQQYSTTIAWRPVVQN